MGKHFDTLVNIINTHVSREEFYRKRTLQEHLKDLVNRSALFEFPMNSKEIRPRSGLDSKDYDKYLEDYFALSQKNGQFLAMPFKVTAVEDPVSVVLLANISDGKYHAVYCYSGSTPDGNMAVMTGMDIELMDPREGKIYFRPNISNDAYQIHTLNGRAINPMNQVNLQLFKLISREDLTTNVVCAIEEIIYIMDPKNFIIRKESPESKRIFELGKKRKAPLRNMRKTVMRPHYICLSEEDTKDFLTDVSREPRAAHPVKGHWRTLASDRYVNKKGQTIYVRQYFTGQGKIEGLNGWTYEVMVKESPTRIVPYSRID
jgi:hypothetical protein